MNKIAGEITEGDMGKRVVFRSLCLWNTAKATRIIRAISPEKGPVVHFGGYTNFIVSPHEVIEILENEEAK